MLVYCPWGYLSESEGHLGESGTIGRSEALIRGSRSDKLFTGVLEHAVNGVVGVGECCSGGGRYVLYF